MQKDPLTPCKVFSLAKSEARCGLSCGDGTVGMAAQESWTQTAAHRQPELGWQNLTLPLLMLRPCRFKFKT